MLRVRSCVFLYEVEQSLRIFDFAVRSMLQINRTR